MNINIIQLTKMPILLCFKLLSTTAISQSIPPEVLCANIKAIYINDSTVILRWVPANFKTWEWGIDSGYVLQRMTIAYGDTLLSPVNMNESMITIDLPPKSQAQWEDAMQNDSFVGVAAAASFGENFNMNNSNSTDIFSINDINSERENRFGLSLFAADMSTLAASMQNYYYIDTQVIFGSRYTYLIKPRGSYGNNLFKPGIVSLDAKEPESMPALLPPIAKSGDSLISLTWNHNATSENYSAYNIFISADSGYTYTRINKIPITLIYSNNDNDEIVYYCNVPDNLNVYCFKIQGHSPFGVEGPLSNPVCTTGTPTPLNIPIWIDSLIEEDDGIKITWDFPSNMNNKLLGFNVLRAPSHGSDYLAINSDLISPEERLYIDASPFPATYYKIEYVDIFSNSISSLPKIYQLRDSIPPIAPHSVSGTSVTDDGVIKIHWSPSASPDVMGYRVFMADQPEGMFGQITSKWIGDTLFFHKINTHTLAEKKYYKIKAIDFRENSSDFSPMCIVKIPDKIPPSKPIILNIESSNDAIIIRFTPSLSKDIKHHQILRRQKGQIDWTIIAVFDTVLSERISYVDTSFDYEINYEYIVQSIDDATNKSNSNLFNVKNTSEVKPAPSDLRLSFNKQENCIEITWQYYNYHEISCFVIYRGVHPDTLRECISMLPEKVLFGGYYNGPAPFTQGQINTTGAQIASLVPKLQHSGTNDSNNATLCKYKDSGFQRFQTYYYAVGVKFEDGAQSMKSIAVPISSY